MANNGVPGRKPPKAASKRARVEGSGPRAPGIDREEVVPSSLRLFARDSADHTDTAVRGNPLSACGRDPVVTAALEKAVEQLSVAVSYPIGRESQIEAVRRFINSEIDERRAGITTHTSGTHPTLQLFGLPGTGKTAVLHYLLNRDALPSTVESCLFLNGFLLQRPSEIFLRLLQHLMLHRGGGSQATIVGMLDEEGAAGQARNEDATVRPGARQRGGSTVGQPKQPPSTRVKGRSSGGDTEMGGLEDLGRASSATMMTASSFVPTASAYDLEFLRAASEKAAAVGGPLGGRGTVGTGRVGASGSIGMHWSRLTPEQAAMELERRFRYGWPNEVAAHRRTPGTKSTTAVAKTSSSASIDLNSGEGQLGPRTAAGRSGGGCTVIVIDEVDRCLQDRQSKVLLRLIDWLSLPHCHCKLITVANSMQLPESLELKTRSRLNTVNRLTFPPYSFEELSRILRYRLGMVSAADSSVETTAAGVEAPRSATSMLNANSGTTSANHRPLTAIETLGKRGSGTVTATKIAGNLSSSLKAKGAAQASSVASPAVRIFQDAAITYLCKQIASHNGDVRRMLQVAAATVHNVLAANLVANDEASTTIVNSQPSRGVTATGAGGVIGVRHVFSVVTSVMHDRFSDFVRSHIHVPWNFFVLSLIARETLIREGSHRGAACSSIAPAMSHAYRIFVPDSVMGSSAFLPMEARAIPMFHLRQVAAVLPAAKAAMLALGLPTTIYPDGPSARGSALLKAADALASEPDSSPPPGAPLHAKRGGRSAKGGVGGRVASEASETAQHPHSLSVGGGIVLPRDWLTTLVELWDAGVIDVRLGLNVAHDAETMATLAAAASSVKSAGGGGGRGQATTAIELPRQWASSRHVLRHLYYNEAASVEMAMASSTPAVGDDEDAQLAASSSSFSSSGATRFGSGGWTLTEALVMASPEDVVVPVVQLLMPAPAIQALCEVHARWSPVAATLFR